MKLKSKHLLDKDDAEYQDMVHQLRGSLSASRRYFAQVREKERLTTDGLISYILKRAKEANMLAAGLSLLIRKDIHEARGDEVADPVSVPALRALDHAYVEVDKAIGHLDLLEQLQVVWAFADDIIGPILTEILNEQHQPQTPPAEDA